jgi:nicotinate-nucleotide pyrophosphorylase (carboxylating)
MTLDELISQALKEDIGDGDHTTLATVPADAYGKVKMMAKQDGILSGSEVARRVFELLDADTKVSISLNDGEPVKKGETIMTIEGRSRTLLTGERLALNFIQRMSGIATYTNEIVNKIKGTRTILLDTRKTTPCNRLVEKMAVKHGGAENHRFGLYDMIMIKDNHVDFAGGIKKAILAVQDYLKENNKDLKIELEIRNFEELDEALKTGGVDRLMLDNFTSEELRKALKLIDGKYETEASGGITIENIREYAETGVDYISVGALTHQIKSLDISIITI